ncbi:hypothetical protein PNQ29_12260 [Halobacterium salinarum]|uniref:hypothetical protein n=1 Tax=Halobacterium salinarum TaxID=2242 RepID=UPI0025566631|nr:hypothetical protein [Halobacterium salinarum]MDL0120493.1 hypothetical protein [Halobacterium salinarum]
MLLERTHITHLLNALYTEGVTTVSIKHPCDDIGELFRLDISDPVETTVRFTQGALTYQDTREEIHTAYGERVYNDLPDAETYVRALVAAGLIDVENADDVETFFRRHGYPDLDAGHEPIALGIDTNLMAWRIPEVLELDPTTYSDSGGRSPVNGFALATGIHDELNWHYNHYETRSLEDAFGPEFARLDDQPAGSNREGFLGLYEYRQLRDHRYADTIESEKGDESIVEAYADYDANNRKRVILLSNDYGFVERARDAGVLAQHVSFPVDIPRKVSVTWDELHDLLYILAVLFGVLELPKVTLYGVWNGKTGDDWQRRRVDVDCRSDRVEEKLQRDRAITSEYEMSR